MFLLLFIVGLTFMAAGVFIVAFAVPIRETVLGSSLLIVGSVAITGGLIAVGLAAAVSELQRMLGALKARPPAGVPRPLRPAERKEGGEKRPGLGLPRMTFPLRSGGDVPPSPPQGAGVAQPQSAAPLPYDTESAQRLQVDPLQATAALRKPGPEWMRRAIAEIEGTTRAADPRARGAQGDMRIPDGWPRPPGPPAPPAPPLANTPAAAAVPPSQVPAPHPHPPAVAPPEARQMSAATQQNMFETVWPSERRRPGSEPSERRPDPLPEPLPHAPEPAPDVRLPPPPPPPPSLPQPPAPPLAPFSAPAPPAQPPPVSAPGSAGLSGRGESRPLSILKSGVIEEMAYTLFSDGSIEAQMPDGIMRFASVDDLRHHLEQYED